MTWIVEPVRIWSRGVDTDDAAGLLRLAPQVKAEGFEFAYVYLGGASAVQCQGIASQMPIIPVTFANRLAPAEVLGHMRSMALPLADPKTGVKATIVGDAEGNTVKTDLITNANTFARGLQSAGVMAHVYEGEETVAGMTADDWGALLVTGYMKSASQDTPSPTLRGSPIGWNSIQMSPVNRKLDCGLVVDGDFLQQDYRGRVATWMRWM